MAERRMLSRTILDSDKFLDLPLTTQVLYIHLIMNADDDGFLNNSQKIIRMIGAAKKDFELLFSSDFIIDFENGICAVKHWKLHNYIRSDRYKPTVYQDELKRLIVAENKVYELVKYDVDKNINYELVNYNVDKNINIDSNCELSESYNFDDKINVFLGEKTYGIPTDNHMETQNRLDEISIDKDSIDKEYVEEKEENINFEYENSEKNSVEILVNQEYENLENLEESNDYFNEIISKWNLLGISSISCIKNTRRKLLKARIKEHGRDDVINAIEKIEKSSFLKGQNDRGWVITFDWFVKPNNFIKVFEGNYDDSNSSNAGNLIRSSSKKLSFNNFPQREYDYDDLEKKLLGWN